MEFPAIRHILVDLDGTLLANRRWWVPVEFSVRAISRFRPRMPSGFAGARSLAAIRALRASRRALANPDRNPGSSRTNERRVLETLALHLRSGLDEAREFFDREIAAIFPLMRRHFFPVSGAREFIDWARGRFPLALATNPLWPEEIARLRLGWAGIEPGAFGLITHWSNMHACKPHPDYYRAVCASIGVRPEECLLVGDDPRMDLPATRVGIRVFLVNRNGNGGIRRLSTEAGHAPAWSGGYLDLRSALEEGGAFSTPASK